MIKSKTSASVIWEERITLIKLGYNCRTLAYRLWGILVHQTILKKDFAVFTDNPSGRESQRLLRDVGF